MNYRGNQGYEILYPKTIGYILPQIIATGANGQEIVVTDGISTITGIVQDGKCVLDISNYGNWTVSTNVLGATKQQQFQIDTVKQYTCDMQVNFFEDASWSEIDQALSAGNTGLFKIGDSKPVTLNGYVNESITFNNVQAYATIIGINHNASIEGNNRLCFQLALDSNVHEPIREINMQTTYSNVGGYNNTLMRMAYCSNLYNNCLPSDLKAVIKDTTKYTDNVGNNSGNVQSNVTAYGYKIFILSEYEILGVCTNSNTYEANYQQQYEFYKDSSNAIKGIYSSPSINGGWWTRSPVRNSNQNFCGINDRGVSASYGATNPYGWFPCFCI